VFGGGGCCMLVEILRERSWWLLVFRYLVKADVDDVMVVWK